MNRWGYVTAAGGQGARLVREHAAGPARQGDRGGGVPRRRRLGQGHRHLPRAADGRWRPHGPALPRLRPRLDFVLSRLQPCSRAAAPSPTTTRRTARVRSAGFVLLARQLTGKELMATVVHELAHLTHFAFSRRPLPAVHLLAQPRPRPPGPRTTSAVSALSTRSSSPPSSSTAPTSSARDLRAEDGDPAPLRLLSLLPVARQDQGRGRDEQDLGAQPSRWRPPDRHHPGSAPRSSGYAGGFEEAWKQFALAGLNPLPARRLVQAVGPARRGAEDRSPSRRVRRRRRQDVPRHPPPSVGRVPLARLHRRP